MMISCLPIRSQWHFIVTFQSVTIKIYNKNMRQSCQQRFDFQRYFMEMSWVESEWFPLPFLVRSALVLTFDAPSSHTLITWSTVNMLNRFTLPLDLIFQRFIEIKMANCWPYLFACLLIMMLLLNLGSFMSVCIQPITSLIRRLQA